MRNLDARLDDALRSGQAIRFQSPLLRESGELKLERIVERVMQHVGQSEAIGPAYAAVRELVQNASKANLKRVYFQELGIDPDDRALYHEGMRVFRRRLVSSPLSEHRRLACEHGLSFSVVFRYSTEALRVQVCNPGALYAAEERRVRDKFMQSESTDTLFDFHHQYGDAVEGAGMGIAMIQILMRQAGYSRRAFSIASDPIRSETSANIILPLSPDYRSPRERFAAELTRRGVPAEKLREEMRQGLIRLPALTNAVETSGWYPG